MLKALRQKRRTKRLQQLIDSSSLELWPKVAAGLEAAHLHESLVGELCALELCIQKGHQPLLQQFLQRFPELTEQPLPNGTHLVEKVLALENPLPMLSALLSADLNPDKELNGTSLVELCLAHPPEQAMLLINRLAQHGASLDRPQLLQRAMTQNNRQLIKFMIDSGAPLEVSDESIYDAEMLAFARRCIEDKKIRDMWI